MQSCFLGVDLRCAVLFNIRTVSHFGIYIELKQQLLILGRFLETQGKGTENSGVSGPLASPRFHPPPTPIATGGNSSTLTTARPADPKVGRDRAARAVETIIKSRPGLKSVNHPRLKSEDERRDR